MAIDTISQIKLNTTTYDICDYVARKNLTFFNIVECTINGSKSFSGKKNTVFSWANKDIDVTNLTYMGYTDYNLASQYLSISYFGENSVSLYNRYSSSVSVSPTAHQLYLENLTL